MRGDPRNTRRYKAIAREVVRQEPLCWLRLPKCTRLSTTADHIIPVKQCLAMGRPDLVTDRGNMRGACGRCNFSRHDKPIAAIRHLMGFANTPALRFFD